MVKRQEALVLTLNRNLASLPVGTAFIVSNRNVLNCSATESAFVYTSLVALHFTPRNPHTTHTNSTHTHIRQNSKFSNQTIYFFLFSNLFWMIPYFWYTVKISVILSRRKSRNLCVACGLRYSAPKYQNLRDSICTVLGLLIVRCLLRTEFFWLLISIVIVFNSLLILSFIALMWRTGCRRDDVRCFIKCKNSRIAPVHCWTRTLTFQFHVCPLSYHNV